jgi:hypothetical protein
MSVQNRAAIVPFPATREETPELVDNAFAEIFVPPDIPEAPIAAAARAVQKAVAAVTAATADLDAVIKSHPPRHSFSGEYVEQAAVAVARQRLARALDARGAAHEAMGKALQERELKFHRDVMERFERASVHFSVVAEALGSVVDPLTQIFAQAWHYRLPLPRLLAEMPKLQECLRVLVAMSNAGMVSPAPVADGDEQ